MIIKVNELGTIQTDKVVAVRYIEFRSTPTDKDEACRLAFRAVNKRREKDYNELAHNTNVIEVLTLTNDAFIDFLRTMP
jgi:hypothetical protein